MPRDFLRHLRPTPQQTLLLKAALLDGDPARAAHREWRRTADFDVLEGASFRLLPLLAQNLGRLGIDDPDLPRLRGVRRQQLYRNRTMLHALAPVLDRLTARGIPVMLLKGAAICAAVREDWSLRRMSDLDVLVQGEHAAAAWREFERCGWRHVTPAQARTPEATVRYFPNIAFDLPCGTNVDLHWRALWQREHAAQEAAFWEDSTDIEIDGLRLKVLSPTHQLLHVLAHAVLSTSSTGGSVDWAADAHAILSRHGTAIDWDGFVRHGQERGRAKTLAAQLEWIRSELSAPIPGSVVQSLGSGRPWLHEFIVTDRRFGSLAGIWLITEVWNDPRGKSVQEKVPAVWHALAWFYEVPPVLLPWGVCRQFGKRVGRFVRNRWKAQR